MTKEEFITRQKELFSASQENAEYLYGLHLVFDMLGFRESFANDPTPATEHLFAFLAKITKRAYECQYDISDSITNLTREKN